MAQRPATKVLLSLLAQTGQGVADFAALLYDMRFHRGAYLRGGHALVGELRRFEQRYEANRILRQLQRRRYVTAQRVGQRLRVILTHKGHAAVLAEQLKRGPRLASGQATVVIFDVPQSQNAARRQLRLFLRQGGFSLAQQSVWVSPRDIYQPMCEFIRRAKLHPWVVVFRGTSFSRSLLKE